MPHRVDIHIGKRLRQRRWVLDATQKQIADELGIRYQQLQKYEAGINRMSASRLWDIAEVLGVPISYFFEGMDDQSPDRAKYDGAINEKEAAEVVRAFSAIPEFERQRLLELARALGGPRNSRPRAEARRRSS